MIMIIVFPGAAPCVRIPRLIGRRLGVSGTINAIASVSRSLRIMSAISMRMTMNDDDYKSMFCPAFYVVLLFGLAFWLAVGALIWQVVR